MATPGVKTDSRSAAYIYCVVRAPRRPRTVRLPDPVPGGAAPALHEVVPGTWLVASIVPLDVYGPAGLEPRLRHLDWVAKVAVAHEAVNEFLAKAAGAVVVPMKLFTLFSSPEKAADDVRARKTAVDRIVRRVAGCEEWGIRITRHFRAAEPDAAAVLRARTGAGFLQARKGARDAASAARAAAAGAADTAFDRLKRHAKDAQRRARGAQPGTNPPILEAAFLVRSDARARFKAEARRQAPILAKAGADLIVTGPWPAYTFVGGES